MTIEFKSNVDINLIKTNFITEQKKRLEIALQDAASEIKERSKAGQDATGKPFKKLSVSYAKYKFEAIGNSNADMTFTGAMLRAIGTKVEQSAAGVLLGKIFFTSVKEASKAIDNMKSRKFFGLSKEQITKIANRLKGN